MTSQERGTSSLMSPPEHVDTPNGSASRPLVVYHGDCPDGFGAAFAAWKRYGEGADYVPVSHGDPPPKTKGRHVLMADFAYDRGTTERLAESSASLVVLDHHRSAASELADLPYCVFDMNRSGAVMAWQYLHESPVPALLSYVQDRDLWRHDPVSYTHLDVYKRQWEEWAADIAESHTSYTTLLYFRSPEPRTSWTLALLGCMDAAALQLALNPLTVPASARPFVRMGVVCLRSLSRVTGFAFSADPRPDDPIELTFDEFQDGVNRVLAIGWEAERTAEEAWPHFRGWRVNYESMAYHLATLVDAPPGPWSGTRKGKLESSLVPVRPPHRAPTQELENLLQVTEQRRAHRAAQKRSRPAAAPRPGKPAEDPPERSKQGG